MDSRVSWFKLLLLGIFAIVLLLFPEYVINLFEWVFERSLGTTQARP
jgi:hypothetical protein